MTYGLLAIFVITINQGTWWCSVCEAASYPGRASMVQIQSLKKGQFLLGFTFWWQIYRSVPEGLKLLLSNISIAFPSLQLPPHYSDSDKRDRLSEQWRMELTEIMKFEMNTNKNKEQYFAIVADGFTSHLTYFALPSDFRDACKQLHLTKTSVF